MLAGTLLACLAAQAGSTADGGKGPIDPADELRALEQRWVDAEIRRDAAAVAELLDEQFFIVFDTRKPIDKEQFVKAVPSFTSTSQVLSEQVVRIAGDTGVVTGHITLEGTNHEGNHYTQNGRYTATYIRRQGRWRALAEHIVQEQPPHG